MISMTHRTAVLLLLLLLALVLAACRSEARTDGEEKAAPGAAATKAGDASPAETEPAATQDDPATAPSEPAPPPPRTTAADATAGDAAAAPVALLLDAVPDTVHALMVLDTAQAGLLPWDVLAASLSLPLELQALMGGMRPLSMGAVEMVLGAEVERSAALVAWFDPEQLTQTILAHVPAGTAPLASRTDARLGTRPWIASDVGWSLLVLDAHVVALVDAASAAGLAQAETAGVPRAGLDGLASAPPGFVAALRWRPDPQALAEQAELLDGVELTPEEQAELSEALGPEAAQLLGTMAPEASLEAVALDLARDDASDTLTLTLVLDAREGQAATAERMLAQPATAELSAAQQAVLDEVWRGAKLTTAGERVSLTLALTPAQVEALTLAR